jgi:hypothetical protein
METTAITIILLLAANAKTVEPINLWTKN